MLTKIDGRPGRLRLDQTHRHRTRNAYEGISRASSGSLDWGDRSGTVLDALQTGYTSSLCPRRDSSSGTDIGTRYLDKMDRERILRRGSDPSQRIRASLGHHVLCAERIAAARAGIENVFCDVTDSDISPDLGSTEPPPEQVIQHLAPSPRVVERLPGGMGFLAHDIPPHGFSIRG